MRIGTIIGHPTQFEGPFFQYAATDTNNDLDVIFYNTLQAEQIFDAEISRNISWGIDLISGYNYFILPKNKWRKALKEKIRHAKYDLFIINGYNKLSLLLSVLYGLLYCKRIALRLDSVSFNNTGFIKKMIKKVLFFFLNKLFDHFFAIGSLTKQFLIENGVPEHKISFFSYVVDNDYFKTQSNLLQEEKNALKHTLKIPLNKKIITCVAKLNERESPFDLFKTLPLIDYSQIHILMIGDGELRKTIEDSAKSIANLGYTFTGYVPYIDLPKYYSISDIFLHCSQNEPWGVSVQEAMACGLPVIASSKVGAAYDLIVQGENGFIYTIGKIEELKDFINKTLKMNKTAIIASSNKKLMIWNYRATLENIERIN